MSADTFYPFGIEQSAVADLNHYKYTGLNRDAESGIDAAEFRNYASLKGRWRTPDPYDGSYDLTNPQSFNRYAYVLNNPLSYTDRLGLDYGYDCGDNCVGVVGTCDDGSCGGEPPTWPCEEYGYCGGPGYNGGYTGSSGTSTPAPPKAKPPAPAPPVVARLSCASKYGQAHSIGAAFGGGAIANFLGGNAVSSLINIGLGNSFPTSIGLGLPINDVLRVSGNDSITGLGSPGGAARTSLVTGALNSFLGTNSSIVSLSGETSISSFAGFATTATTVAEAASWVGIGKFVYDGLAVGYGYAFACSQ